MAEVTLDIETIPGQADRIVRWCERRALTEAVDGESVDDAFDRIWRRTSLDGAYGEIISVAAAIDDRPVKVWWRRLHTPEADLVAAFISDLSRVPSPCLVGHNLAEFDRNYIRKRCIVRNIKPPPIITMDVKPWEHDRLFDTMEEWRGARSDKRDRIKLGHLAFALGLQDTPEKGDVNGGDVWDLVRAGREEDVAHYNADDVELNRAVAKRMRFR